MRLDVEAVDPYAKYNRRHTISLILKFIWTSPDHRNALLQLMYVRLVAISIDYNEMHTISNLFKLILSRLPVNPEMILCGL